MLSLALIITELLIEPIIRKRLHNNVPLNLDKLTKSYFGDIVKSTLKGK